jgi:predicted transcriptional regulator
MKSSCVSHPSRESLVIIRRWQVEICDGNQCAAALISYFEYWHNWKLNSDSQNTKINDLSEREGNGRVLSENVYQYHKLKEIIEGTLGLFGRNSVINAIKLLKAKSILTTHDSPNQGEKTRYYRFYPEVCAIWLEKNYQSSSNKSPRFKNKPRSFDIKPSGFENKLSEFKKGRYITKINNKDNKLINLEEEFVSSIEKNASEFEQGDNEVLRIVSALIDQGLPEKRFNSDEVFSSIRYLIDAGASEKIFIEAYHRATHATQNKSFSFNYLIPIVRQLLAKAPLESKSPSTSSPNSSNKSEMTKNQYQTNLTHGQDWINDEE